MNYLILSIIFLAHSSGVELYYYIRFFRRLEQIGPPRKGDVAICIASNEKAKEVLGWQPKVGIKESIRSTYEAYMK